MTEPAGGKWREEPMDWDQQGKLPRLHPSTPHMDPASLNITATSMDPGLLDLPWHLPLEDWPKNSFAALPGVFPPTSSASHEWTAR